MPTKELPYVHRYRDRHGAIRRYVRRRGQRGVALPGNPGTPEFMAAYTAALADRPVATGFNPGSFGDLWRQYQRSAKWANLSESSRSTYAKVVATLLPRIGHRSVAGMTRDHVEAIVHAIGTRRPAMANLTLSVLRLLLEFAVAKRMRPDNPARRVDRFQAGAHHTWTDHELQWFEQRWPLGTRERLAYALLLYTGQRGGDVVRMRRSDLREGLIYLRQQKTRTELVIPVHPVLDAALKAYPAKGLHLIGDSAGRPITRDALTKWLGRAIADAGLPDECVPHGLRKAAMRRLAERGADVKQIAAVSGHKSLREVQRYTDAANQITLSRRAISLLTDD